MSGADEDLGPLDDFHRHEVLHTASIMASLFEEHIGQHRYTQADPELKAAAENISQLLANFYQLVGQR